MQINWFTVIAQIINFLILVWLLKRYLYQPILKAIDEREKKIADQLHNAELKNAEALKEKEVFLQKNETFEAEKNERMNKVVLDTTETRKKLLEEARTEATELSAKLELANHEVLETKNLEISKKIEQEVLSIARKTLLDLASTSLEEQSVNVFIKRMKDFNASENLNFIAAFKSEPKVAQINSAFDLSLTLRSEIQKSINAVIGAEIQFQFKVTPELISGIELTSNGYKIAWSISEYLSSFEKSISETIQKQPNEKLNLLNQKNTVPDER